MLHVLAVWPLPLAFLLLAGAGADEASSRERKHRGPAAVTWEAWFRFWFPVSNKFFGGSPGAPPRPRPARAGPYSVAVICVCGSPNPQESLSLALVGSRIQA